MKEIYAIDNLFKSIRQYYNKVLLEPNEFISLFDDSLHELQITKKIDSASVEKEILSYLVVISWFDHISKKITQSMFKDGIKIGSISEIGAKAQNKQHSDDFTKYTITQHIEKLHREHFKTPMRKLRSHNGIKLDDIKESWHSSTQENGVVITIEVVASSIIQYQRSYIDKLTADGLLPELSRIQEIFSHVKYSTPSEPAIVQVLELSTELYLKQFEISSILLPFHRGNKAISDNIDKIYALYSPDKDKKARKIKEMLKVLRVGSPEPTLFPTTRRKQKTHSNGKITEITNKSKSIEAPAEKKPELEAINSKPQPLKITDESTPLLLEKDSQELLSSDEILQHYCEKISDNKYLVVDGFYLIKENTSYSLCKNISKDETPEYKTISKNPFFVIAKTHLIEDDTYGVRIASISEILKSKFLSYNLGDIDGSTALKKQLNNKGYGVNDIKTATEYIHLLVDTPNIPIVTISNQIGWINDQRGVGFVLPKGKGIGITGLEYSGENPNLANAISQGGSLQEWLSIFDIFKIEEAHPRLQFLIFSALMPLFADFFPLFSGITINIGPDDSEEKKSSNGKSVMLRFLLSLQGNSTESSSSWFGNWKVNALGIENSLYTGIGSYRDDTSIRDADMTDKLMEDIIYSISTGKARTTSVKDGRDRRTILFSSGESDILRTNAKDGAYVRFINIGIKRTDYGPGDTRPIVEYIEKVTKENYGFIYPVAIRIMLEKKEDLLQRIEKYQNEFSHISKHDLAARLAKQYAVIAVCGEIFIEAMRELSKNHTKFDTINAFEVSKEMFMAHDTKLLNMDNTEQQESNNMLYDFLNNFTKDGESQLYDRAGVKVGFVKDDKYYILSGKVKGYLPKGVIKPSFMKEMERQDQLVEKSKAITLEKKTNRYDVFIINKKLSI